jgi:hypothetical protein
VTGERMTDMAPTGGVDAQERGDQQVATPCASAGRHSEGTAVASRSSTCWAGWSGPW